MILIVIALPSKQILSITHVVLRNSMGGNSWTGYRLGELFREKGVTNGGIGFLCVILLAPFSWAVKYGCFLTTIRRALPTLAFTGNTTSEN